MRTLFCEHSLIQVLNNNIERAKSEVEKIPHSTFIASENQKIINYVFSKTKPDPLKIFEDQKSMVKTEVQIDERGNPIRGLHNRKRMVPGISLDVFIPYNGDDFLWECQPSSHGAINPTAKVKEDSKEIVITITIPTNQSTTRNPEKELGDTLYKIQDRIQAVNNDLKIHCEKLKIAIEDQIDDRKKRLKVHSDIVESLNIPIRANPDAPDTTPIPIEEKIVEPLPEQPSSPEHTITDDNYESVLRVIRHGGRTFEATPKTYAVHNEEELRDIILSHLNCHFKGQATGETFRVKGKTDIRIEAEDRSAFIGECKVWRGAKEIDEGLDQFLGYLTWRDCKGTFIIFNKENSGFIELQNKVPGAFRKNPKFINEVTSGLTGEWRFQFQSNEDKDHVVLVHVFLFNLFVPPAKT